MHTMRKCAYMRALVGILRGGEMRNAIVLGLALFTCACVPKSVVIREPVTITHYIYVPVDRALTAPCPVAKPRNRSVGESLRVNRERRLALEDCDARMSKIRAIQGTQVPK